MGLGFIQISTAFANTHSVGSLILLLATVFIFSFYIIWLIITLCANSDKIHNKYGKCPKIISETDTNTTSVNNSVENLSNSVESPNISLNNFIKTIDFSEETVNNPNQIVNENINSENKE